MHVLWLLLKFKQSKRDVLLVFPHLSLWSPVTRSNRDIHTYIHTSFIIFPHGGFSKKIWYTILQFNTNILKLIILHSNLDNHKFKNSTINCDKTSKQLQTVRMSVL